MDNQFFYTNICRKLSVIREILQGNKKQLSQVERNAHGTGNKRQEKSLKINTWKLYIAFTCKFV